MMITVKIQCPKNMKFYLCVTLSAMLARYEPLAAVLLDVLLRVPALNLRATLVLAVDWFVPAVTLVLL